MVKMLDGVTSPCKLLTCISGQGFSHEYYNSLCTLALNFPPFILLFCNSTILYPLSGFVDVFAENREAVVNHGRKLLKVSLVLNRDNYYFHCI